MSDTVRAAPVIAAILLGCALGRSWADESPGMATGNAGAGQTGAEIYVHICQGCHMPQGQGAVGAGHYPSLAHNDALAGRLGEVAAASIVLKGRNGMPAFGHPQNGVSSDDATLLSDAQIAEIVNYIRSHFGNRYPDQVSAAQVAKLPHPTSIPSF